MNNIKNYNPWVLKKQKKKKEKYQKEKSKFAKK